MAKPTINISINNLIGTLVLVSIDPKETSANIEKVVTEALTKVIKAAQDI